MLQSRLKEGGEEKKDKELNSKKPFLLGIDEMWRWIVITFERGKRKGKKSVITSNP